ncbi:MAG: lytic transglycosylase domain-containing protein, partial [Pseudomonadota bacterium]
ASLVTVSLSAFGIHNRGTSKHYSVQEVAKIVGQDRFDSSFPITVNQKVVDQINRIVGNPKGQETLRKAMANYKNHEGKLRSHLERYGFPEELLSIPFVESRYKSLPASANPKTGAAGLWQFIASTARVYGLKDRLDLDEETDAAMRYLGALRLRFKDWQLAILSYNAGEGRVQAGIDQTGSRDPWVLIDEGFEGDHHYLPKVMAAVVLMKYPELR